MKLEDRMNKLEAVVTTHLEESGAIRTDLKWLKHAFWTLTGAVLTFAAAFASGLILYIIHK